MQRLILASGSAVRAKLLREAGVSFDIRPADVNEAAIRTSMLAEGKKYYLIAETLAKAKARQVSSADPQALVLGCDQILVFENRLIGKSADLAEARALLHEMSGKWHQLLNVCVLMEAGEPAWSYTNSATLRMRHCSDAFLDAYLQAQGEEILFGVGGYRLEGLGVQLFERLEGDYFSVLGLPLIPLLAALREHGIIAS